MLQSPSVDVAPLDFNDDSAVKKLSDAIDQGDFQYAARMLDSVTDTNTSNYWFWRGWLEQNQNDSASALDDFRKALRIDPDNSEAYASLAFVLYQDSKDDDAIDAARTALKLDPNNVTAWQTAALCFEDKADFPRAIGIVNKSIHLRPNDPFWYEIRGDCYAGLHDAADARKDWQLAYSLDPSSAAGKRAMSSLTALADSGSN